MTDHIGIGEIHDNQVMRAAVDSVKHCRQNLLGRHFRLQIISGHLWRVHQMPVLSVKGGLIPAIEKEGHMRIFFGFGYSQLAQPRLGYGLAKAVAEVWRQKQRCHVVCQVICNRGQAEQAG